jgi:hypothetical protein
VAISEQFTFSLVRSAVGAAAEHGLLPALLARACVEVLGVDGASISLMSERVRMPLGADGDASERAEQLQFSLGEGPCMEAYRTGLTGRFSADEIARRWPLYWRKLVDKTPYRSCATAPLDLGDGLVGSAMNDVEVVAAEVTHTLLADTTHIDADRGPTWLHSDSVRARANLWVAIGLFLPSTRLSAAEVTALIRAYAFRHDESIDQVTQALARRELDPRTVLDE